MKSIYKKRKTLNERTKKEVIESLQDKGYIIEEDDDFDFLLNGKTVKFKMTTGAFQDIPLEIINNRKPGWYKSSKAELFCYYMEGEKVIYVLDIAATRKWTAHHAPKKSSRGSLGGIYYLAPISELKMHGCIREVIYV